MRSISAGLRTSLRSAGWALEEGVIWRVADLLRGAFDVIRWPFERVAWVIERAMIWPLRERDAPVRSAVIGGVALLAAGALALGAVRLTKEGGDSSAVAVAPVSSSVETTTPKPTLEPAEPVLEGAAPDFTPGAKEDSTGVAGADAVADTEAVPGSTTASSSSSSPAAGASSSDDAVEDPGPAAIDVARRFSGAFVLYETGDTSTKVRTALAATATPQLTQALLRRPPRLPANVEVPKAKVLNVVPGPRNGGTFTLSASLLRVGITSELRIDVRRGDSGRWQVTDVLG